MALDYPIHDETLDALLDEEGSIIEAEGQAPALYIDVNDDVDGAVTLV